MALRSLSISTAQLMLYVIFFFPQKEIMVKVIYGTPWYWFPIKTRKCILQVLNEVHQTNFELKALKIYPVNMASFSGFLMICYILLNVALLFRKTYAT